VRPLVRETAPLLTKLRPSVDLIDQVTAPDLIEVGKILNRTVNVLAHNPEGKEEGYLFHLAWYSHNAASVVSLGDAHGVAWRGLVMGSCSTFPDVVGANPALLPLSQLPICGFSAGGGGSLIPPIPSMATPKELVDRAKAPTSGAPVR
jgi:phospholipid/cholesterol/gamma-HCH transport system substrate-binding protein